MRYGAMLVAATMLGSAAQAVDYRFSFFADGGGGLVTGTVYGLAESGTSAAFRVEASYDGTRADFPTLPQPILDNEFTVNNGTITAFRFAATRGSRAGDYVASLNLDDAGTNVFQYVDLSAAGRSFDVRTSDPGRVSFAALPEPASWACMIAGFGAVGLTLRRHGSAGRARLAAEIG